jgi:hypothetical protein
VPAAPHLDEGRAPGLVGADDLAVKDASLTRSCFASAAASEPRCLKRLRLREDEACAGAVDFEERAEAVVFQLQ